MRSTATVRHPGCLPRLEVRFGPHCSRSTTLVTEMLNGAADDLSPIELRARAAATALGAAPLPIPTHMSEQVSYPG